MGEVTHICSAETGAVLAVLEEAMQVAVDEHATTVALVMMTPKRGLYMHDSGTDPVRILGSIECLKGYVTESIFEEADE